MQHKGPVLLLSTIIPGEGMTIARLLIEEHLAACVNILPAHSVYRWKGEICEEKEDFLVIKTETELVPFLQQRIRELHPYQVPEMIVIPILGGYGPYLNWLHREIAP
jgi:periplasmic divalent cation tolerance protein